MNKPIKLGAILTVVEDESAIPHVVKWTDSAKSVYAITDLPLPPAFGLVAVKPRKKSLRDALQYHLNRIRGREVIALCLPPLALPTDFAPVHALMVNKTELSWAFYAKPDLIILTTSMIPIILSELKDDVPFAGSEWYDWLKAFLIKRMMPHKLFDVSKTLGLEAIQPIIAKLPDAWEDIEVMGSGLGPGPEITVDEVKKILKKSKKKKK